MFCSIDLTILQDPVLRVSREVPNVELFVNSLYDGNVRPHACGAAHGAWSLGVARVRPCTHGGEHRANSSCIVCKGGGKMGAFLCWSSSENVCDLGERGKLRFQIIPIQT